MLVQSRVARIAMTQQPTARPFNFVLSFVEKQVAAGRTRDETIAMREPLARFEAWGPFGQASARDPLTVAYDEVTSGA